MEEQKVREHFLVPKHEIIPAEKESIVLDNFGVKKEALPKIPKDDPVVEEIGAERGEIIKITRSSITSGKTIYFRVVQ